MIMDRFPVVKLCAFVLLVLAHSAQSARNKFNGSQKSLRVRPDSSGASRRIALLTPYGRIILRLLDSNAPNAVASIERQAQIQQCDGCNFYRAEARPNVDQGQALTGPPYGLLQGRMDLPDPIALEGAIPVKAGHVAFIPNTKDFFIALNDHDEWGTSHTVFAEIADFVSTDLIAIQPFHEETNAQFGTVMRMMDAPVDFRLTANVED